MKIVCCPKCGEKMRDESMGWRCPKCKGFVSFIDGKFYPYIERPFVPPVTNADRIRAMSDEELAAYLAEISGGTILKTYKQLGLSLSDEKSKKYLNELTAEYLKRLQQPAEEDT